MELLLRPNPISLSLLIPAAICLALALYAFLSRPAPGSRVFAMLMMADCIWSLAYSMELSSLHLEDMLFLVVIEYIGIVSIAPLWLMLTMIYTGREKSVNTVSISLLSIIPMVTLLLNATNGLHHLYYSAVSVDSSGPFPLLAIGIGPGYILFFAYMYLCLLAGVVILALKLRSPATMYRRQAITMLISMAVPWMVNILYLAFNFRPFGHLDLTPFAFTISGLIMGWGIYRYHLFDVAPLARDLVIENMGEGMVAIDTQERITDCNAIARNIFGWLATPVGQACEQLWQDWPDLLLMVKSGTAYRAELTHGSSEDKRHYEVVTSELRDRHGLPLGCLMLVHDITIRKRAQEALRQQEEKFQTLFKTSRDAVFITTPEGRWLEANEAAARMFGYATIDDLKERPVTDVYASADARGQFIEIIREQGYVEDFSAVFQRADGQVIDVLISAVANKDDEGRISSFQGTIKDITHLKKTEAAVLVANEQLTALLAEAEQRNREITLLGEMAQWIHSSRNLDKAYAGITRFMSELFPGDSGAIAVVNGDSKSVRLVNSFGELQGKEEFPIDDCFALKKVTMYEYDGSDEARLCPHLAGFSGYYMSMPLIVPGEYSWLISLRHTATPASDGISGKQWIEARRPLLTAAGQEIELALANVRLRETLREQATRDPLTGLYNRRYMDDALDRELRASLRSGRGIGFIMGDIDHFKRFNDLYGHEIGDVLLKAVANVMRGSIRVEDIVCRYGGEEFLVILPSASLEHTHRRAEQLRLDVSRISFTDNGRQIENITISLGVAAFPENGKTAYALIAAADGAMYKAKRKGRNRVCLPG